MEKKNQLFCEVDALFSWDGVCVGTAQYSTVLTNTCRHVPNPTKLLFSGDTLCGTAVHHTSRYTRPNLKKKVYFQTRSKNSVEAFFSSIIDSTFFPHQPTVFPLRKNFDVSKVPKKFRLPYIRVFFFFSILFYRLRRTIFQWKPDYIDDIKV